eukprot:4480608-Prymnesium_polylepis.1
MEIAPPSMQRQEIAEIEKSAKEASQLNAVTTKCAAHSRPVAVPRPRAPGPAAAARRRATRLDLSTPHLCVTASRPPPPLGRGSRPPGPRTRALNVCSRSTRGAETIAELRRPPRPLRAQDDQRARRGAHRHHDVAVRAADVRVQDRLARARHLGVQPSPAHVAHLRLVRRVHRERLHLHPAQEFAQEVHHDRRPAHADLGLPLRSLASGQPAGEGGARLRDGAAVGHPPDGAPAQRAARARVPQGHGAARVDPHAAQRAAAAVALRRDDARARHVREQVVGRRAHRRHHHLVHARLRLAGRVQAHARGLRVGPAEPRHGRQPARLPAVSLREGPDAAVRPLPWLLHGARRR